MQKEDYKPDTLVVLTENAKVKDMHIMRVIRTVHRNNAESYVECTCLTCGGVIDRFDLWEIREATLVEKAEYRLLGAS